MSNSKLVNYIKLSPNYSKRPGAITKITIHHMAGNLTVEQCGNIFASSVRQASSNYGIGTDGRVGMYVEEKNRAWTSSNKANDNVAVTIEVANDGGAGWSVSKAAYDKLIDLCVDICERNGIKQLNYTGDRNGNLTMHCMFTATSCPGDYLKARFPQIAQEVNERLKKVDSDLDEKNFPYLVRVTASALNVRAGVGVSYKVNTIVKKNEVFTIVDEVNGWGKLKSGAGWICLYYTERI